MKTCPDFGVGVLVKGKDEYYYVDGGMLGVIIGRSTLSSPGHPWWRILTTLSDIIEEPEELLEVLVP